MFHLLGFIFIIIIAILFIGFSILGTVIRGIFGFGKQRSSSTYQNGSNPHQSGKGYSFNNRQQSASSQQEEEINPEEGEGASKHKKLFSKDEGEYVDFEEV